MTGPQLTALRPRVKSPFLDGLAPHDLDEVLAAARECRFLAGTVLASQGTPANSLFLLVSGRARFFLLTPDGHKIVLMWLPAGEVIGRRSFADPAFRLHREYRDGERLHHPGLGQAGHPPAGHTLSAIT